MDYKLELGVWVVASLVLSIAGAWLAWRFRHMESRSAEWLRRRLLDGVSGRIFLQLIRLLYYVGLPYFVVLRRVLSLVMIGLRGSEMSEAAWWLLGWQVDDWAQALGWAAGLGSIVAILLALAWRNAVRAQGQSPFVRGVWPVQPWWVTLREVVYNEIHWAFYRVGPQLVLSDTYWAVLIGAAFPLLEWLLDPDWWVQIRGGPRRELVLMQFMWLATSTVYFLLARNVWLALMLHLVLALALNRWLAFLIGHREQAGEMIATEPAQA